MVGPTVAVGVGVGGAVDGVGGRAFAGWNVHELMPTVNDMSSIAMSPVKLEPRMPSNTI